MFRVFLDYFIKINGMNSLFEWSYGFEKRSIKNNIETPQVVN